MLQSCGPKKRIYHLALSTRCPVSVVGTEKIQGTRHDAET